MRFRRRAVGTDQHRVPTARSDDDEPLYDYTITVPIGGFNLVSFRWLGTSREDARDSFLEWLYNDDEFADGLRVTGYRSLYVRFNGRRMLLTFRTDWIAAFTIR